MGWFVGIFLLVCSVVLLLPIFFYMPVIIGISLIVAIILSIYGGIKISKQRKD